MTHLRAAAGRLTCRLLALAMVLTGLSVLVTPQAQAAADAVVSGTVVDSLTHQPLASVTVADSTSGRSTTTAIAGTYSLSVPAGSHVLTATLVGYVPSSTPTLTLTVGQTLTNQGFTLVTDASASGIVTEKGTSTGVAAIVVKLFDASTQSPNPSISTTTGPDGSWSIAHVTPGSYKVQYDTTGTDFTPRWHEDAPNRDLATALTFAPGEAKTLSGSLTHLGRISGHIGIFGVFDEPLAGATITAISQAGATTSATTDANGDFEITGLLTGYYQVRVNHPGYVSKWLRYGTATDFPVQVTAGETTQMSNEYVDLGSTITGVVHVPEGVTAIVTIGGSVFVTTDAAGSFTMTDVPAVGSVNILAWGYEPLRSYFTLSPGGTATIEETLVASTTPPTILTGTVVDTAGAPVAGATVRDGFGLQPAVTAADGTFSLHALEPSSSSFYAAITAPGYVPREVFSSAPALGSVTLLRAATVSGRVTVGPGGAPASRATVELYGSDGNLAGDTLTDADGLYAVTGLDPGYYIVQSQGLVGPASVVAFVGGATSRALATYVSVPEGSAVTGQDMRMMPPGSVSGVLTYRGGPAPSGATVGLVGNGTNVSNAQIQSDGSFVIQGVPPGVYRLWASYINQTTWWNGAAAVGGATEITVSSGDSLTGYGLVIPPSYLLSGTVRTAAGVALQYVRVIITGGTGTGFTDTDDQGRYSVRVPAGSYELQASTSTGRISAVPDALTVTADTVHDIVAPDKRTVTLTVTGSDGSVPLRFRADAYTTRQEFYTAAISQTGVAELSLDLATFSITISAAGYLPKTVQLTVTTSTTIPVTLDIGGRVSGVITGASAAVTAINVVTGERIWSSFAAGPYTLAALPAGDYVVTSAPLTAQGAPCGWAVWSGGSSYSTARRFHMVSGTAATGVDLSVSCIDSWQPYGGIAGHVVLPADAQAGAAAAVIVTVANAFLPSQTFQVGPDGSFASGSWLEPGTYMVTATQPTLGLETHSTVTVQPGLTSRMTLTLTKLARISGHIVGPMGEPVPAFVSDGQATVRSDAAGSFTLGGVANGAHTLKIQAASPYAATTFQEVTVTAGLDVAGLVIHVPLAGSMSGQVPATMGPVEVTVYDAAGRVLDAATPYLNPADPFTGAFHFFGLPPGPTYVRFSGTGIVMEWWNDAVDRASATPVAVPEGSAVTDIYPTLSPAVGSGSVTHVSGKVTGIDGPVAGVTITALLSYVPQLTTTTASDGTYSLTLPRGDTYTIKAEVCIGPHTDYIFCTGQYFLEGRDVAATGSAVTGVDFSIPAGLSSFGVIVAPVVMGVPVVGQVLTATVAAWTPTPDSTTWQWFADGVPVLNATSASMTLTAAQSGHRMTVEVTRSKSGYVSRALMSTATDVVTAPSAGVAGAIHALAPARLLDSRIGLGFQGPAGNGTVITLPVWTKGGVPQGASAVLMNLTVTGPTASGFLTAYASGGSAPGVSNANFTAGATLANLSLIPIGADGAVALRTSLSGTVHVIADVQGYVVGGAVSAEGAIAPVTPSRVLDTRSTQRVPAGGSVTVQVAGLLGVPADAAAVVANITVTGSGAGGYLTAFPAGVARPTASNVNFVAGQTVPNLAIVKVGSGQSITIASSASSPVDVIVDLQGYVTAGTATLPGTVKPITPTRVVDTRSNLGAAGPVPAMTGRVADLATGSGLAALPQGALINLTVADPQTAGWLAAYPPNVTQPGVSNLNFTAGKVVPNLSLATLDNGSATLFNGSSGSVQIVADVLAYVLS